MLPYAGLLLRAAVLDKEDQEGDLIMNTYLFFSALK